METTYFIIAAASFATVAFIFLISYVKAPPAIAFIISGISKMPRVLIGKGGIRVPFFERLDKVYLGQITVDIKTGMPVPTSDFINVDVDAVAKVRVLPTPEGIRLAAKNFLNMNPDAIAGQLQDSLQGNLREIIGTLDLRKLNTDRDGFSDQVLNKATPDMNKLGIEIISCNIQNVSDKEGLIKDLGADNTAKIKKEAAINKAIADKEVAVQVSKANKEANDARIDSETSIAEKNTDLALRKADLQQQADTRKAIADAAYTIQQQEQQKTINTKTIDAEIERAKREQELSKEQITITENELISSVNRKADAEKYQKEKQAEAELEQRKRKSEAEAYEAKQRAEAMKSEAEALKFKMEQEALGIKARGEAEAYSIEKKGIAEAEAMEKKAEAYNKYGKAAVADMMIKIMPQVAESFGKQISAIDSVNIYGSDGNSVSGMSGNMPVMMKQFFDTMSSATGVNMQDILKSETIEAKTNRNIDLSDKTIEAVAKVISPKKDKSEA